MDAALPDPAVSSSVLRRLKRIAGDAQGKVTLEFILGTHAHVDHIGGFPALLRDPDIRVKRAYLKPYDNRVMQLYEQRWGNHILRAEVTQALAQRGVPLTEDIPAAPFALGKFRLTIYNGAYRNRSGDENESSMVLLAECGGKRALLTGDINNITGTENRVAKQVGKVDLLQAPHHGDRVSSTLAFVARLNPDAVVFTAEAKRVSRLVLSHYICAANPRYLLCTETCGGVAAVFEREGIACYGMGGCGG